MLYSFPQLASKSMFQTYNVVRRALVSAGHIVTADIDPACDAVLYSLCDVMDMPGLRRLRKQTNKPIIAGGHFAFNYWSAKLYSDIVWIGEVYDFADMTSISDIANSESAYTGVEKTLKASRRIDWEKVPVTQIAPKKAYYLGGVGCKNNCHFCFTSWTHENMENSEARIASAVKIAKSKKIHLMISSNAYNDDPGTKTRDMMLIDYIKRPVSASLIRIGIEFATEESRKKHGKPITRDQIYAAIQKADIDNTALRLFHITGYDTIEDWEQYIDDLCVMFSRKPNKRLIHLMFTNLQYQNYTPMYRERYEIDPNKYIDHIVTKRWYDKLRQYSTHILVGPPSPFRMAACRMGIELSTNMDQSELWMKNLSGIEKLTTESAYRQLVSSGVLDTPRHIMKKTGEIRKLE